MKKPLFTLFILLIGFLPSCITIVNQQATPMAVDNKSTSTIPAITQPDNKAVKNTTDAIYAALKSTVLIFSTNQLEMEKAKNTFWDGIELIKPIISQRQVTNYPDIFRRSWKQGSGVLIDKNGYILTSRYAIEDCDDPCSRSISHAGSGAQLIYVFVPQENGEVKIERGQEYIATVICKHPQDDLAIIKITPRNATLPYCALGDSNTIQKGQRVTAIGYPTDLLYLDAESAYKWKTGAVNLRCEPTLTDGVISAKRKYDTYPFNLSMDELNADYSVNLLQTDASLNYGNSGGPLIDNSGMVVGNAALIVSGSSGLGFAVAINEANDLVKVALARPIQGIPDGAFLSCEVNDYCFNQTSWEANPYRRCNQICDSSYADKTEVNKCTVRCRSNLYVTKVSTTPSQSTTEKSTFSGFKYNNDEYRFSVIHPINWYNSESSLPIIYKALAKPAGIPSISVGLVDNDKYKEAIGEILAGQGGSNFIWVDYPEYVLLNDGKTKGKFSSIKLSSPFNNPSGMPFKALILAVNIPNNKILAAWSTTFEDMYDEEKIKEILLTFTVDNALTPSK